MRRKILVIDNYDSFVYNLAQYIGELGHEPVVRRNDAVTPAEVAAMAPAGIVVSPGPCTPLEAGASNDIIREFSGRIPILGVCLGHQCIAHVFGAVVGRALVPVHGKKSLIYHDSRTVFAGIPNPIEAGRYHSLVAVAGTLPDTLEISARTEDGVIMGIRHRSMRVEGLQFHPESILTPCGHDILRNFLDGR